MIPIDILSLFRVGLEPESEFWVCRVSRPGAPNPSQPACDLAVLIAYAKAVTLVHSALADAGQAQAQVVCLGEQTAFEGAFGRSLEAFHGGRCDSLWLAADEPDLARARQAYFWPSTSKSAFRKWLEKNAPRPSKKKKKKKVRRIQARVLTEADYDLTDCDAFAVDDVMWLEDAYGRRWLDEGHEAWVHPRPATPSRTEVELRQAKRPRLLRYMDELRSEGYLRELAFCVSDLIPLDVDAALACVDELIDAREAIGPEWSDVCWAIGWASERLVEHVAVEPCLRRWRAKPGGDEIAAAVRKELHTRGLLQRRRTMVQPRSRRRSSSDR